FLHFDRGVGAHRRRSPTHGEIERMILARHDVERQLLARSAGQAIDGPLQNAAARFAGCDRTRRSSRVLQFDRRGQIDLHYDLVGGQFSLVLQHDLVFGRPADGDPPGAASFDREQGAFSREQDALFRSGRLRRGLFRWRRGGRCPCREGLLRFFRLGRRIGKIGLFFDLYRRFHLLHGRAARAPPNRLRRRKFFVGFLFLGRGAAARRTGGQNRATAARACRGWRRGGLTANRLAAGGARGLRFDRRLPSEPLLRRQSERRSRFRLRRGARGRRRRRNVRRVGFLEGP